jgi:hypothetical protein
MKRYFGIFLVLLLVITYHNTAKAQVQEDYYLDGQGRPIRQYSSNLDDIKGSPFLNEQWEYGSATNTAGKTYNNLRLKYDILDDIPVFAGANNEMMGFPEPIKTFTIGHSIFANGFPPIDTLSGKSYYVVLTEGKALLLKHITKHIQRGDSYGSAVPSQRFVETDAWYLFKEGKMIPVHPNRKDIIAAIGDKKTDLETFASNSSNKKLKGDAELAMIVVYYNSLQ